MRTSSRIYQFDSYQVDCEKRLLLRNGQPVPLTSKVFDTLLILLQNKEKLMEKQEMMKLLWPDTFVEEGNLTVNISLLRKALEETPDQHRFIVTVPGRGYRFIAQVQELEPEENRVTLAEEKQTQVVIE